MIDEKAPEIRIGEQVENKREEQLPRNQKLLISEVIDLFSGVLVDYSLKEGNLKGGGWEDAELEKSDEGSPEDAG